MGFALEFVEPWFNSNGVVSLSPALARSGDAGSQRPLLQASPRAINCSEQNIERAHMQIVSVINYKGGVGKTSLTANLAAELAFRGKKILLVDLDAQASLTF